MSDPFPGKGRLRPVDDELRRLKKERIFKQLIKEDIVKVRAIVLDGD